MTDRPTSDPFDRDLRAVLAEPTHADAPLRLRSSLATLPVEGMTRSRLRFGLPMRGLVLVGVGALLLAALAGPTLLGGGGGGAPRIVKYAWTTPTVLFEATDISIGADSKTFVPPTTPAVHSDPGDARYTTLETYWSDNGHEMRLFIYFQADGTRWWSEELRTYDDRDPADWITYRGRFFDRPLGQAFDGDLNLSSGEASHDGVTGTLRITGLHLEAFRTGGDPSPTAETGPVSTTVEASAVADPPTPEPAAPSDGPILAPAPTPAPAIPASPTPPPTIAPSNVPPATPVPAVPEPTPTWSPAAMSLPGDQLTLIDDISIADDHRTLTIDFVGWAPFDPNDPCSSEPVVSTMVHASRLQVALFEQRAPRPSGFQGCDTIGHQRRITVTLDQPFTGNVVYDMRGYTRFFAPPSGLVQLSGLPKGWNLVDQHDELSDTGQWVRRWEAATTSGQDARRLELYQTFGARTPISGGDDRTLVTVNGIPAWLQTTKTTGELVLTWQFGADGLALLGSERDFTREQFVALAESIVAGG